MFPSVKMTAQMCALHYPHNNKTAMEYNIYANRKLKGYANDKTLHTRSTSSRFETAAEGTNIIHPRRRTPTVRRREDCGEAERRRYQGVEGRAVLRPSPSRIRGFGFVCLQELFQDFRRFRLGPQVGAPEKTPVKQGAKPTYRELRGSDFTTHSL